MPEGETERTIPDGQKKNFIGSLSDRIGKVIRDTYGPGETTRHVTMAFEQVYRASHASRKNLEDGPMTLSARHAIDTAAKIVGVGAMVADFTLAGLLGGVSFFEARQIGSNAHYLGVDAASRVSQPLLNAKVDNPVDSEIGWQKHRNPILKKSLGVGGAAGAVLALRPSRQLVILAAKGTRALAGRVAARMEAMRPVISPELPNVETDVIRVGLGKP